MIKTNGEMRLKKSYMGLLTDVICYQRIESKPIDFGTLLDAGYSREILRKFVTTNPIIEWTVRDMRKKVEEEDTIIRIKHYRCSKCEDFLISSDLVTYFARPDLILCDSCSKKHRLVEGLETNK